MRSLLALPVVVLALTAAAVPAAPQPPDPRVATLVGQLGSPDFRAREDASQALVALGEPALAAVKAAAASDDPEVARRAADAAAAIAANADAARTLAPTLVELDLADTPLLTALAALQTQTGFKVGVSGPGTNQAAVTVKTAGKVPFWEAVERLTKAADVELVADPSVLGTRITYPGGDTALPPAAFGNPTDRLAAELKDLDERQRLMLGRLTEAGNALTKAQGDAERTKARADMAAAQAQLMDVIRARTAAQSKLYEAELKPPPPPAAPPVVLRRRADGSPPASVFGAVRVSVVPFPAAELGTLPAGVVPVTLQAAAEPRLRLERVASVRVTRAVDDAGRDVPTALSLDAPAGPPEVTVSRPGLPARVPMTLDAASALTPGRPTQAVVPLRPGDAAPRALKHLDGVVRAVVRTGAEELAAVRSLDPARGGVAAATGVRLTVSPAAPGKADGQRTLTVTAAYNPAQVEPDGGLLGAATSTVVMNGGGVVVRRQFAGGVVVNGKPVGGPAGAASGVRVRDAAGKELTVAVTSRDRQVAPGVTTDVLRLTVTGTPAAVTFTGTRAKVVEVPFQLANVALGTPAAGTAPATP